MFELSDISKAFTVAIDGLTNAVGLLEKNIKSYFRISNIFEGNRYIVTARDSLSHTSEMYNANTIMQSRFETLADERLYELEQLSAQDTLSVEKNLEIQNSFYRDCDKFFVQLEEFSGFLEGAKKNIISIDYKIYEELARHVSIRKNLIQNLRARKIEGLSAAQLFELSVAYMKLIDATAATKEKLQSAFNELKSSQEKRISDQKEEPKKSDDTKVISPI